MDKDTYLEDLQISEREFEEELDELTESEVENLKIEHQSNLLLLEKLLVEITNQINKGSPDLLKIKELIVR